MDQEILDAIKAWKEASAEQVTSYEDIKKNLDKFTKQLKQSDPALKQFKDFLGGNTKQLIDANSLQEEYNKAIDKVIDNTEELSQAMVDARVQELQSKKNEELKSIALKNSKTAIMNFGIGLGGVANTMLKGALDFVEDLQSGKEGTEVMGNAAKKAAQATGEMVKTMGALAEAVGAIVAILPVGKIVKILGGVLAVAGIIGEQLGPKLSELAERGIGQLTTEIEKTKKGFRDISSTGAFFVGGMTEMRNTARSAGIDIGLLGEIAKNNGEALSQLGLGVNEGIKRFASINKEIRNGQLAMEFRRLGLDTKEYGEAAIQAAGMLQASGKLRSMGDKDVAQYTLEYTKNLKVLQNITGEDAKKKMEQAKQESLQADLFAKAMKEGGPDAVKRLQAALATVPDELKAGAMQYLSGDTITDAATRVAMSRNPALTNYFDTLQQNVRNTGASIEDVQKSALTSLQTAADYAVKNSDQMGTIAKVGRLTGDSLASAAGDIQTGLIKVNMKLSGVDIGKNYEDLNKTIEGGADKLGDNINTLDEKVVTLQSILGDKLTPVVSGYASVMNQGFDLAKQLNENMKAAIEGLQAKVTENANANKGPSTWDHLKNIGEKGLEWGGYGALGGSALPGIGTVTGGVAGVAGGITQGILDEYFPDKPKGKAKGGISTGPISGYQEILHGTEAVVPLPDGKTIPVKLDSSSLSEALNQQTNVLKEVLSALNRGNRNTAQISMNIA